MGKIIFDMPNSDFKKAFEKKLAEEFSDNNFLDSSLNSEMPIQWGYKALSELQARTKDHPYWKSRIGKHSISISEASSDAPKKKEAK